MESLSLCACTWPSSLARVLSCIPHPGHFHMFKWSQPCTTVLIELQCGCYVGQSLASSVQGPMSVVSQTSSWSLSAAVICPRLFLEQAMLRPHPAPPLETVQPHPGALSGRRAPHCVRSAPRSTARAALSDPSTHAGPAEQDHLGCKGVAQPTCRPDIARGLPSHLGLDVLLALSGTGKEPHLAGG